MVRPIRTDQTLEYLGNPPLSKHDEIAGSLIDDILSGRYRPTERLPSERDLAARFDANRGAVREAMKKLEQMGLADVQPGGARVRQTEEASLDVIGHMLGHESLPDLELLDQILVVMNGLMTVAAEQALQLADDREIAGIRALVKPLIEADLDREAHVLARFELMHAIMTASRNLPLRLTARTLMDQFVPKMSHLHPYTTVDFDAYRSFGQQLDAALEARDAIALRASFKAFNDLNRQNIVRAIDAARADMGQEAINQ